MPGLSRDWFQLATRLKRLVVAPFAASLVVTAAACAGGNAAPMVAKGPESSCASGMHFVPRQGCVETAAPPAVAGWHSTHWDRDTNLASCAARLGGGVIAWDGPADGYGGRGGWPNGSLACSALGLGSCVRVADWECTPLSCTATVEGSRMVYCNLP
jgi:hypothetical protein